MKRQVFSYLFTLLFALLPLETIVGASGDNKTININGVEYTESGTCANKACVNFDDDTVNITLNKYDGGPILVEGYETVNIATKWSSYIRTTGEYGIKTDAKKLNFASADNTAGSLSINVDSATNRANGILMTNGSVEMQKWHELVLNVKSATPRDVITTDSVTGITTPLDQEIIISAASAFYIWNPTGNYSIYTGKYIISTKEFDGEFVGLNMPGDFNHKITDGIGDAFYYNDFEGSEIPANPKVDAPRDILTFTHNKWGTSGEFRFTCIFGGVSANFGAELTSGEDFASANARLKSSVTKEENDDILATYSRYYDPFSFEIDNSNVHLVIADDFSTGEYHEAESDAIESGEKYALYIPFWLWETEWSAFSKIRNQNHALLNGEETSGDLFYIDPGRAYALAPLSLDGTMTDVAELEPAITMLGLGEATDTTDTPTVSAPVLPKAPNTGIAR